MAAGVVALPVALGGVVALPEQFQQVAEVEGGSAPHHTHNFRVSRSAGADRVVGGLLGLAARIPHSSAHHPRQSPEPFFSTPEAPTGKDCFLLVGHQWSVESGAQNHVAVLGVVFRLSLLRNREPVGQHGIGVATATLGRCLGT